MVALENLRSGCRGRTANHQNILDADWNASKWTERISLRRGCVHFCSLRKSALLREAQIDVEPRIHLLDALVVAGRQISGLQAPRCNPSRNSERVFGFCT